METARGRLPSLRALQDPPVSGQLRRVVEAGKGAVAPSLEGFADHIVGQVRVLGQQRAVQVGADDVALDRSLGLVGAVVSLPHQNSPSPLSPGAETGRPAV